jgi:uncharacterized membrane protein YgdD (TMEM256/DUF423 family)
MKVWLVIAAINGGLAVLAGAFAQHGLQGLDAHTQGVFETGVRYHIYHALAMGLAAVTPPGPATAWARAAATLFLAGIILFCGSLYLLTLDPPAMTSMPILGLATPIGGLAFMAGWAALAIAAWKQDW